MEGLECDKKAMCKIVKQLEKFKFEKIQIICKLDLN